MEEAVHIIFVEGTDMRKSHGNSIAVGITTFLRGGRKAKYLDYYRREHKQVKKQSQQETAVSTDFSTKHSRTS